jgi:hypothetical protein
VDDQPELDPTLERPSEDDWVLSGPGDGAAAPSGEDRAPELDYPGGVTPQTAAVGAGLAGGLLVGLVTWLQRRRDRRRRRATT